MKKISLIAIVLCLLANLFKINQDKFWRIDFVIIGDTHGYYEYLPAVFIHHDIDLEFYDLSIVAGGNLGRYYYAVTHDNHRFIKYPMGVAVMEMPFFTIAYWLAPLLHQPADGYSDVFEIALLIGVQIYLLIGLLFLRKLLLCYFNDFITAITILSIVIGTNLYIYCTEFALMSHVFTFSLSCIFLYYLDKWTKLKSTSSLVKLGLLSGLLLLIRNTNFIWILMFALTNLVVHVRSNQGFKKSFFISYFKEGIIVFCLTILIYFPQLLYWHHVSGTFFFDSYPTEKFFFKNPHFLSAYFGYRSGWLLYSPMLIFSFLGILFLNNDLKKIRFPLLIVVFVFSYLAASWWCWWYSGFGNRAFVDIYALMALTLAACFSKIFKKPVFFKISFAALITFLIYLNFFQTWQFTYNLIHYDSMTERAYWAIFLKRERPIGYNYLLKSPDSENAYKYGFEKE